MAALDDLINQIEDETLRERIRTEVKRANKQKKFGLVFEQHLPEATPLYDVPVKKGSVVALKGKSITDLYLVEAIVDGEATCLQRSTKERVMLPMKDLVSVAQFGEPIYPYLQPIDSVCNAPDSDLWHTLIEADNYHALQLLEYLYAGKVDCIYIDPPYNTGARDWKYNNDYVDGADSYRHSKWLSMMEKRLRLVKKLLNPRDSVLIVTIDEKEFLHLGCLLEEMFPNARIQMISSVISPQGNQRRNQFSRIDEYIFFVEIGNAAVQKLPLSDDWRLNADDQRTTHLHWQQLIRNGSIGERAARPNLFYPIFLSKDGKHFIGTGEALDINTKREDAVVPDDVLVIWPMHKNGKEGHWGVDREVLVELQKKGYVKLGPLRNGSVYITYLQKGMIQKVENGDFRIEGYAEDGSIISTNEFRSFVPGSQWRIPSHDASRNGSNLLRSIFNDNRFSFPKSLYATHDAIRFFVANKPGALIVDFFAGSGTTLHAVNLLNSEDGGHRRCILVTNNEVSVDETNSLSQKGFQPGDPEWENLGIARYVTWRRTVCSIKGVNVDGEPLKGNYLGDDPDKPRAMSEGFAANAAFFKLGFWEKTAVSLGRKFKEMLPLIWMKAGTHGPCPSFEGEEIPQMMILPENQMAVLNEEWMFEEFASKVNADRSIKTVFLITDSETSYKEMASGLRKKETHQLYREYLDNFRVNQSKA